MAYVKYSLWPRGSAKAVMHTATQHEIRSWHRRTLCMYAQVRRCRDRCLNCVEKLAHHHGKVVHVQ